METRFQQRSDADEEGRSSQTGDSDTAEELFFARGYEETSVQDILDAMGLSKGGFYHHFESKMSVLEEISQRRAEKQYAKLAQEMKLSNLSAVNKLNHLFSANNLFEREEPKFVRMVLRVCDTRREIRR